MNKKQKSSKKEFRNEVSLLIKTALAGLKDLFEEKDFEKNVNKASKIIVGGLKKEKDDNKKVSKPLSPKQLEIKAAPVSKVITKTNNVETKKVVPNVSKVTKRITPVKKVIVKKALVVKKAIKKS